MEKNEISLKVTVTHKGDSDEFLESVFELLLNILKEETKDEI